ncbi:hypothetical protein [Candidatus Nitrosocosmicus sp. FF01]|uniref:hypothetical protein n=1 Tax=Candidatus Nitrosocosmicus sp. FF01 TaxID=3397670 RepID=UPI0039E7405B
MVKETVIKHPEDGSEEHQFELSEDELANLNWRLDKYGFKDIQELIDAFSEGKFPPPEKTNEQQ